MLELACMHCDCAVTTEAEASVGACAGVCVAAGGGGGGGRLNWRAIAIASAHPHCSVAPQAAASPRMTTAEEWALSPEQRQETVERMAKNISAMAFFRGQPIADAAVQAAAAAVEKKAYTVARVEARTTTGVRWAMQCCRQWQLRRRPRSVGGGGGGGGRSAATSGSSEPPAALLPRRRPHHETLKAYIRKLSALALEVVQTGGSLEAGGAKAQGEVGGGAALLCTAGSLGCCCCGGPWSDSPALLFHNRRRSWT